VTAVPTEEQRATCKNCGRAIIWYFDRDDSAAILAPYGFWYDAEHLTEACGGPDGEPGDEDVWHEPDE
jgi:hypothetical protein